MVTLQYSRSGCNANVINKKKYTSPFKITYGVFQNLDPYRPTIIVNRKNLSIPFEEIDVFKFTLYKVERFYFVDKLEVIDNERIKYYLRCDLLSTFNKWLVNQYVQINEGQELGIKNKFLSNRSSVFDVRPKKKKIEFSDPNKLDKNGSLIMITIKGSY